MAGAQGDSGKETALAMLTAQFLAWIAARPRSYEETMEAWRSSCPRLSVWEDALGAGLVALQAGDKRGMRETRVVLTDGGWAALAAKETVTISWPNAAPAAAQ